MAINQRDSFTQNFQTSLIDKLLENEKWNSLGTEKDITLDLKEPYSNILLLNDNFSENIAELHEANDTNDINDNRIQHADQYDITEFECVEELPDLSAKDLIIQEVIEDLILRTFCEDNGNEESDDTPRIRRCSSLKTGKTPPGTPSCKKIVRFADVLGLDLADVRTYLDDIPRVPSSAYKDLVNCEVESCCPRSPARNLLALFQQPACLPNFLSKVTMSMVVVENAYVDDPVSFCIKGSIRVRNLSFHKSVHVRYTMDKWRKSSDVEATYVEGSNDGFTDRFQFMLYAYGLEIGEKLEFAVRYRVDGQEYWDNNDGNNYCFQCLPADTPQQAPMTPGIHEQFVTFYYNDDDTIPDVDEQSQETKSSVLDAAISTKTQLSSLEMQELIARSLTKHKIADGVLMQSSPKPEVVVFFVVLFLSVVLFYAKRILF